jgi:hypothetical protein
MDIHFMLYDPAHGRAPEKNQARMQHEARSEAGAAPEKAEP